MDVIKKIEDYSLEEIMSLRFAAYAKEIIQDRAIPDVRDGLKPVQRRILYAMYKAGNTSEKGYIKCAGRTKERVIPIGSLAVNALKEYIEKSRKISLKFSLSKHFNHFGDGVKNAHWCTVKFDYFM